MLSNSYYPPQNLGPAGFTYTTQTPFPNRPTTTYSFPSMLALGKLLWLVATCIEFHECQHSGNYPEPFVSSVKNEIYREFVFPECIAEHMAKSAFPEYLPLDTQEILLLLGDRPRVSFTECISLFTECFWHTVYFPILVVCMLDVPS